MKMRILSLLLIATTALASDITDRTPADLSTTDSGWQKTEGSLQPREGATALLVSAELTRTVGITPGLYELQVFGGGAGLLALSGGGENRTQRLASEPGLYGLLFEVSAPDDTVFTLSYSGGAAQEFVIDWTAIAPADAERQAAWAAAQESYQLLGYYGTDPQRAAPGSVVKLAGGAVQFSAADLARWAIDETVLFYDPTYDTHWVNDAPGVAAFFTRRGVPAMSAIETERWMKARSEGDAGIGSSIIFAMGMAPMNVVYAPYAECLLADYMRAGGRVVWLSNIPMYLAQGERGPHKQYGSAPSQEMLGLTTDRKTAYGTGTHPTLTAVGKAWGLEPASGLVRPVHTRSVTLPFVTDPTGEFTGVGLVNLRPEVPFSGFIFVPDIASPAAEALLSNVYRFARYSGTAVDVPAPDPLPAATVPIEAALRYGDADRRMVYLRGEMVPLVLRAQTFDASIHEVSVHVALYEGDAVLRENSVMVPVSQEQADALIGAFDLSGLRVGIYTVAADVTCGAESIRVERELRIAPLPDHRGTHIALSSSASPKQFRTENRLDMLASHNLEPMFWGDLPIGRDLALWYGFSYSSRRHGHVRNIVSPLGYDTYRRGGSGEVLRVRAHGDKRESHGFASPFQRQAEADEFGRLVAELNGDMPAFRKRTVTADDYSQWFGLDYNRFAVEGFRARYGIEPPRPIEAEDPFGTVDVPREPGIVADDDPWLLLCRYWSETLGDSGRRFARAMEAATGGEGKVGSIPGAMQIPTISMWSGQYPPFNSGKLDGFSMASCYYYNSYWQPPMTHVWWLEAQRMGNRDIEQWLMPESYHFHYESFYRNNLWLLFAGGAQGIPYFTDGNDMPEALSAMRGFGAWSKRFGLLLEALRPLPKRVAMLVPFENVTIHIPNGYMMAYSYMDFLLAKTDVEPVSPEELNAINIKAYEAVILTQTKWLKAGTAALLEDYIAGGGTVVVDSATAAAIPIAGATMREALPVYSGSGTYGQADRIAAVREALLPLAPPVVDCDDPFVMVRRAALPDGTPGVWLVHNYTKDELGRLKRSKQAAPDEARALEDELGYRQDVVTTTLTREDDGRIPFDVFGGRALDAVRMDGKMTVALEISKWDGMLIVFLPALPATLEVVGVPKTVTPGIEISLGVYVRDSEATVLTTPLPLQLTLRDPEGHTSREYARRLLTEDGSVTHSLTFAVNDLRGEWVLEVEDVLTGVTVEQAVVLKSPSGL
ncbi:MAG: hypothetical protein HQ523_12520 [Lentisphaerae bacterium]|nr:hypothetical protein [Lentisphaerota bacterium]